MKRHKLLIVCSFLIPAFFLSGKVEARQFRGPDHALDEYPLLARNYREGDRDRDRDRDDYDEKDDDERSEKRERIEKRVNTMLMWRLTEILDMDEKRGAKIFPVIKKYESDIRRAAYARQKAKHGLRKAVRKDDRKEIKRLLDEFTGLSDKIHDLRSRERKELEKVFNTTELAQYIMFQADFEREVREMIFDARRRKNKKGPRDRD